jgi:hypothetical protein
MHHHINGLIFVLGTIIPIPKAHELFILTLKFSFHTNSNLDVNICRYNHFFTTIVLKSSATDHINSD